MRNDIKENLKNLSKEQLIYIISQLDHFYTMIGERCVRESKGQLDPAEAINQIRQECGHIQFIVTKQKDREIGEFINMELGKITKKKYRNVDLQREENND